MLTVMCWNVLGKYKNAYASSIVPQHLDMQSQRIGSYVIDLVHHY